MSAISAKARDFVPLSEFKRIVREKGFTKAIQLRAWLRSQQRPVHVPKYPERIYRSQGWVTFLEALGRPRAAHHTLTPEELSAALGNHDLGLLRTRFGKMQRAEAAVVWAEELLSAFGYETRRLPQRLQGSLLVREMRSTDSTGQAGGEEHGWWAVQVRCSCNAHSKSRTVLVSRNHKTADIAVLVADSNAEKARMVHLDGVDLRAAWEGLQTRQCFSVPTLHSVGRHDESRSTFVSEVQDVLARCPSRPSSEWLTEFLPCSESARRWQRLYTQLANQVVVPSGLDGERNLHLLDTYDVTIAGRKCAIHSCPLYPRSGDSPRLTFIRTRVVKGRRVSIPFGNLEDVDFLIALLYDGVDDENAQGQRLVGFFLFPYQYLTKWGISAKNFSGGQSGMTLYPPGHPCVARHRRSKYEQVKEQHQFYIEMPRENITDDKNMSEAQERATLSALQRFRTILLGNYDSALQMDEANLREEISEVKNEEHELVNVGQVASK
ncbi:unnamed protein product [Amoebophrya sp. A25]|nr:unnamed protein product [Amoebophrya sp. A25]|eukprot:GSA25T00015373001.1